MDLDKSNYRVVTDGVDYRVEHKEMMRVPIRVSKWWQKDKYIIDHIPTWTDRPIWYEFSENPAEYPEKNIFSSAEFAQAWIDNKLEALKRQIDDEAADKARRHKWTPVAYPCATLVPARYVETVYTGTGDQP